VSTTRSGVVRLTTSFESVTLPEAVEAFLAERDLATSSRRKYRATLELLVDALGTDVAVAEIPGRRLVRFLSAYWGDAAPATWNRHRATLRSFFAYCRRQRWLVDDPTEATAGPRGTQRTDAAPCSPSETAARPWRHGDALTQPATPDRSSGPWSTGRRQEGTAEMNTHTAVVRSALSRTLGRPARTSSSSIPHSPAELDDCKLSVHMLG
jgi:hypothetical protein